MLIAIRWNYFLDFVLSAVSRNIKDHRVIFKSPDKHLDIWRPFWQETVRPLIILAAGRVNKFQACFPSCHVELYCPSVPLRVNIPHRRSNLSCSFNFGRETVNCQCCREFDWIASLDTAEDASDAAASPGAGDRGQGEPRAPGHLLRGLQLTTSASNRGKRVKINVSLNCQNFVSFTSFVACVAFWRISSLMASTKTVFCEH